MRNRLSSDPQLAQPKDLPRVRGHIAPEALKAPGTSAGCNALGLGSCLFWSNFRLRFHLWTYVWPVVAVDVFNPSPKSKGGPGVVFPQADLQIWSLPWLAFINGGFERVDWCTSSHTCNLPCKESCLPIVHGFTHTMGHCRSYRHNAKISKFCSGLAASDSLRLKHFFCLHVLAQTNNQTCKEASYILV